MHVEIVKLVGFLVANLCHDEKEWHEWALPFLEVLLDAQECSKAVKARELLKLNDMFSTLVDSKLKLVCEEADGFIHLHVGGTWWEDMLSKDRLEEDLAEFLQSFIAWASISGNYDSRTRVVARKMYQMLQSHEKFVELENRIFGSLSEETATFPVSDSVDVNNDSSMDSEDIVMNNAIAFDKNRAEIDNMTTLRKNRNRTARLNGTVTERVWKVSLAATVGATLMSLAAVSTAPAIINATVVLLGDTSISQFVLGMSALLTSYGLTGSSVMGTMGAYSATVKMLHRTEPLQEFHLDHLIRYENRSKAKQVTANTPIYLLIPGHCNYTPPIASSSSTAPTETNSCDGSGKPLIDEPVPSASLASNPGTGTLSDHIIENHYDVGTSASSTETKVDSDASHMSPSGANVTYITNFVNSMMSVMQQSDRDVWGADPEDCTHDMVQIDPCSRSVYPVTTNGVDESFIGIGTELSPVVSKAIGGVAYGSAAAAIQSNKMTKYHENHEFLFETDDRYKAYDNWEFRAQPLSGMNKVESKGDLHPDDVESHGSPNASDAVENEDDANPMENSTWDVVSKDAVHSGWWKQIIHHGDEYLLRWDRDVRETLSASLHDFLTSKGWNYITHELLMLTPAATILNAASLPWPISVLHSSLDSIDNPWVVALEKAKQAGRILAMVMLMQYEVLHAGDMDDADSAEHEHVIAGYRDQLHDMISNEQDIDSCMQFIQLAQSNDSAENVADGTSTQNPKKHRPITLVGYGIGARVIVHCLETLVSEYKMYGSKDYIRGLVENVVLMGTPYGTNVSAWRELRNIVPGRFINCYSTHDWLLALMFRQCTWELGVAGLGPVVLDQEEIQTPSVSDANTAFTSDSPSVNKHHNEFDVFHVENVDITSLIRSHADYPNALQLIIPLLRLEA